MGSYFAFDCYVNPWLTVFWPVALQNELIFEAVVTTLSRGSWLAAVGKATDDDTVFDVHRGNVIARLHQRVLSLKGVPDDVTMWTVNSLISTDYQRGDIDAATAHYKGLLRMLSMRSCLLEETPFQRLFKMTIMATKLHFIFLVIGCSFHFRHIQLLL